MPSDLIKQLKARLGLNDSESAHNPPIHEAMLAVVEAAETDSCEREYFIRINKALAELRAEVEK